ncbi:alcohol dehydrogenase catalytic domain-containing protein [Streptomyces sp. 4N509B]|uniref:alcohol dehydrogenase catalytic domain-containing protein n=1 Tax=Streptomyces sp. 4N509B TaxID=3457413 RepID=UPI003FD535CD
MRAVRWHGRRDVRYETAVPDAPDPGPGEVRVAVAWCGLCGSDVAEYAAGPLLIPVGRAHPVTGRHAPLVLGHEIAGHVTDAGPGVTGLPPGTLVALNALIPCGRCARCAAGDDHLCPDFGHLGMSADGGLAERVTVPAAMAVAAPPGLDPEVAALAEPFAVAWHLVRRVTRGAGDGSRCLVVGAGAIGLATALVLRERGHEVTVVDVADERLRVAAGLGLRVGAEAEAVAVAGEGGEGADAALECSGSADGFALSCRAVRPGGVVGLAGLPARPVPFDVTDAAHRELTLVGSMSHQAEADLAPALGFLAAHAETARRLVTARVPLRRAVADGLDVLGGPRRGAHTKILIDAGGTA